MFRRTSVRSSPPLMEEIDRELSAMRRAAAAIDKEFFPPVLAMGIFERVGSNWFCDSVRHVVQLSNEPFRQHLHPSHPLSPLNSRQVSLQWLRTHGLHSYARRWLVVFVLSKYGPVRQLIKETNLFFAVDSYFELFPDAPVIVLTRRPVGIASSFVRGDLFNKWGYAERYSHLESMVMRPRFSCYKFVMHGEVLTDLHRLARMMVLNTLLLVGALRERPFVEVAYENAVANQSSVMSAVSHLLLGNDSLGQCQQHWAEGVTPEAGMHDGMFNTRQNKSRKLLSHLRIDEIAVLRTEIDQMLGRAAGSLAPAVVKQAGQWLKARRAALPHARRGGAESDATASAEPFFRARKT